MSRKSYYSFLLFILIEIIQAGFSLEEFCHELAPVNLPDFNEVMKFE